MTALATSPTTTDPSPQIEADQVNKGFLQLLPAVERHAAIQFRHRPDREDLVSEAVAAAFVNYRSTARNGKTNLITPSTLARFAVADLTMAIKASFKTEGFVSLTPRRWSTIAVNWSSSPAEWQSWNMYNNALRDTKRAVRHAGIKPAGAFTLTCFRKSYAQNCAENGVDPKTLAELLGHSDVSMTMQFYRKVTDANIRAARAAVDQLFAAQLHQSSTGGRFRADLREADCA